jgi:hypothetical protein
MQNDGMVAWAPCQELPQESNCPKNYAWFGQTHLARFPRDLLQQPDTLEEFDLAAQV